VSERHRRRHNWQGVVLSQRVQMYKLGEVPDLTPAQAEAMRKRFAPTFDKILREIRVAQGIDRWEDEGGSYR
jgi:hypothetical protein